MSINCYLGILFKIPMLFFHASVFILFIYGSKLEKERRYMKNPRRITSRSPGSIKRHFCYRITHYAGTCVLDNIFLFHARKKKNNRLKKNTVSGAPELKCVRGHFLLQCKDFTGATYI